MNCIVFSYSFFRRHSYIIKNCCLIERLTFTWKLLCFFTTFRNVFKAVYKCSLRKALWHFIRRIIPTRRIYGIMSFPSLLSVFFVVIMNVQFPAIYACNGFVLSTQYDCLRSYIYYIITSLQTIRRKCLSNRRHTITVNNFVYWSNRRLVLQIFWGEGVCFGTLLTSKKVALFSSISVFESMCSKHS